MRGGERPVVETDFRHGSGLDAASKIYNEHQAEWYSSAYDMQITGLRPAHVTGWDKVRGSIDHVRCMHTRWSWYHGGVVLLIYMDLMALSMILFFLLYPYALWLTRSA